MSFNIVFPTYTNNKKFVQSYLFHIRELRNIYT